MRMVDTDAAISLLAGDGPHTPAMQTHASSRCRERTRKQYAMNRLRLATDRLMHAGSDVERDLATRWLTAWAGAIGELQFSAVVKGRFGRRKEGATGRREGEFLTHPERQLHNNFISPRSAESKYTLENYPAGYAYKLKWVMNPLSRNVSRVSDEGLATSVHPEVPAPA